MYNNKENRKESLAGKHHRVGNIDTAACGINRSRFVVGFILGVTEVGLQAYAEPVGNLLSQCLRA